MRAGRGIKTIIGSFFRKRGQMGAEASSAAFLVSVFFVVAVACMNRHRSTAIRNQKRTATVIISCTTGAT